DRRRHAAGSRRGRGVQGAVSHIRGEAAPASRSTRSVDAVRYRGFAATATRASPLQEETRAVAPLFRLAKSPLTPTIPPRFFWAVFRVFSRDFSACASCWSL